MRNSNYGPGFNFDDWSAGFGPGIPAADQAQLGEAVAHALCGTDTRSLERVAEELQWEAQNAANRTESAALLKARGVICEAIASIKAGGQ
jgi:hypothetical protein